MKRTIMEVLGWKNSTYVKAVLFEAFQNYRKQLKNIQKAVNEIDQNIQPILRTIGVDELGTLMGEELWDTEWAALTCNEDVALHRLDTDELNAIEHLFFLVHTLPPLLKLTEKTTRLRWKNRKLLEKERAKSNELWASDDPKVFTKARYTLHDRFENYMLDMEDEYIKTGRRRNGEESREPLL
ncbi:MAG: hypothetical protein PHS57_08805 [Alphaproteobacteria bacterium]|nr:hypothetical protein [Alphaproteobacteria bacterium]